MPCRNEHDHLTDPGSSVAIDFGVFGIPETVFIDRDGTVVAEITGESDTKILSDTLDRILAGQRAGARTVGDALDGGVELESDQCVTAREDADGGRDHPSTMYESDPTGAGR